MNEQKKREAIKTAIEALKECANLGLSFSLENRDDEQSIAFNEQDEHLATYTCKYERELVTPSYLEEPFFHTDTKVEYNYDSLMGCAYEPMLYSTDRILRQEIIKELSKKETVYLIYTFKGNNHKKIWRAFSSIEDAKKAMHKYEKFNSFKKSESRWISGINGEDLHYWLNVYR